MISPEDLESYGYGNEAIFTDLENRILSDIVRRIRNAGVITRSADFQLNQLKRIGFSDKDIKDMLQDALNASDKYIDDLYDKALETDYIDNKKLYEAKSKEFVPYSKNTFLQNIVKAAKEKTKGEMHNLANSLGFIIDTKRGKKDISLTAFFQQVMDEAIVDIQTGGFDYNTTLRKAITEMTNSGIRWIDYDSGWHNRITVAARRSVMSAISDMSTTMARDTAKKLGIDTYEVSAHANPRPTHAVWQGNVYSFKELEEICGLGSVTGLLGANCYHLYYPYIEGVSKRAYTEKQLEEWRDPTPKEYEGKEYTGYEAKQRMRQMETNMRAMRERIDLLKKGEGSEIDILNAQSKYRIQMQQYKDFAKHFGMKEQKERIYIDGLGKLGTQGISTERLIQKINLYKGYEKAQGIVIGNSGLVSTRVGKHFIERAVERDISPEKIIDALNNPLNIGKIKVDKNGWSQKVIGQFATVVINPGDGNLITVYKTSSKVAKKLLKSLEEG